MAESQNPNSMFANYEYRTIVVLKDMDSLWANDMRPFGWTLEKEEPVVSKHVFTPLRLLLTPLAVFSGKVRNLMICHDPKSQVTLTFKRERGLEGKDELDKLQLQYEICARNIETLEKSKKTGATAAAYGIGLIGTIFMAISVFSYLATMTPTFIFTAVLGFLGWLLPIFVYKTLVFHRTQKVAALIECQKNAIYAVCQQAANITCVV